MKRSKHKSARPPKAKKEVLWVPRNQISLAPHPAFVALVQVLARAEARARILREDHHED